MRRVLPLVVALMVVSCGGGGGNGPTAPSGPTFAQIAGNWSGTLESSNYSIAATVVNLTQAGGTVTGTWAASGFDVEGTISGGVDASRFTGVFTWASPSSTGGRCTGQASVSGSASTANLIWTTPGFTSADCELPLNVTLRLQRR